MRTKYDLTEEEFTELMTIHEGSGKFEEKKELANVLFQKVAGRLQVNWRTVSPDVSYPPELGWRNLRHITAEPLEKEVANEQ